MSPDSKHIKIVYLVGGPLTQRWLDYYQVDAIAKVYDVEFWNCFAVVGDGYVVSNPLSRDYVVTIKDLNDYLQNLKRLPKDTLAVVELGLVAPNYSLLKLTSRYVPNGVIIDFWTYAPWDVVESSIKTSAERDCAPKSNRIKTALLNWDAVWFINRLSKCRSREQVKKVFADLAKRRSDRCTIKKELKCKSLFHLYEMTYKPHQPYTINHPDYEKYLLIKDRKERTDRYVVFIADFYPYHPEILMREGYDVDKVAHDYYQSLNLFFDKVEAQLNCKVVIAEHPSGKWEYNPFNGREIVYYKTAELVRDSMGVCLHESFAISYAALFNKPVAVVFTSSLRANADMELYTPMMAKALQRDVCNIDTVQAVTDVFHPIDENIRKRYIQTFADADSNKLNAVRMKEHFISIHNDIIRRQS